MSKVDDSAQSVPPTERERDVLTYLNTIKSLKEDMDVLEKVRKVVGDEVSVESLGRSIEVLRGSQDKLYRSLQVKYGVDMERADKIITTFKSEADMLTKLRERVAAYGDEAVKAFENSGQFDAGVLKDLANRAVDVQGVPEQIPTEHEKIVAELIDLRNAGKRQEYKEKFDEVVKRPDKEQIIKLWENAIKLELKIEREAESKEQDKSPYRAK
jgi:hypothetical protein